MRQRTDSYTTALGIPVPGVTSSNRQASAGIDFSSLVAPLPGQTAWRGGFDLVLTDDSLAGQSESIRYRLGLTHRLGENATLNLDLTGERDFAQDTNRLGVTLQVDWRF